MAVNSAHPVLDLMSKADVLGREFDNAHRQTLPAVEQLVSLLNEQGPDQEPSPQAEVHLGHLRAALEHMEHCVNEMIGMLYSVDVFLAAPTQPGVSSKDPKTALEHVSDSFHMYQSELLNKREALADLTCGDITPHEFGAQWCNMEQVKAGRQQTMDDLADLLAGLG